MPREGAVLVYCAPGSGHAAPLRVTQAVTIFRTVTLLSLVCRSRTLQDCSDRVLAEPDMAADQPVAQTSLCQLEDLLRLAVRWTLSWLAAEPLTACLGDGDAGLDALADKVPLELGERRHHRGDHLAVRRRQVELQA